MELSLLALNPATGTQLPLPLFIISGVVLAACIVVSIVVKKGKGGMNKRGKKRKK